VWTGPEKTARILRASPRGCASERRLDTVPLGGHPTPPTSQEPGRCIEHTFAWCGPFCLRSYGSGIEGKLLALVAHEGVLDWALRCTANPHFEIRRCLACSEWFLPLRLRRSRFCSNRCRNAFHFLKDAATFACDICARTVPVAEWSGLSRNPDSGDLRISGRERGGLMCTACVAERYPQWQRYIDVAATASKHGRPQRRGS